MWWIIKKLFVIRTCGICGKEKEISRMVYAPYKNKPTLVCHKCDKKLWEECNIESALG